VEFTYFGMLRSPVSWAKIGRELSLAFMKNGDKVHIYERRGFSYNKDFKLPPEIEQSLVKEFVSDKTLSFEHPNNYKYITTEQKFGMLVYETTVAPKVWAEKANETLDILFLPNELNRKIFIDAGVKPELIRVVPHGINEEIYGIRDAGCGVRKDAHCNPQTTDGSSYHVTRTPQPVPRNKFQFLCVAMPQRRKGIDVLLSAFEKAFDGNKNIELLIKFPYEPGRSKYDILMPKLPENVKLINAEYTEEQMADLYRSADCFVLPSRAEGFGLVYLEALSCGIPVIATGWGGHMEFLNDKNSLLVEYKAMPAGGIQYDNEAASGLMAEPSEDDLVDKLRHMFDNYIKEAVKAENIDLSGFYWRSIAARMQEEMQERI
jgi:glycosyltransferase involved in cell wall biosynthesis